ncbi:hypothetical protein SAMN05421868_10784 [Paenibacillus naphthalenovorans]|nr:hypothetical protein SAMN05421868_10784 [Paenibacillus naphthalenovorans]
MCLPYFIPAAFCSLFAISRTSSWETPGANSSGTPHVRGSEPLAGHLRRPGGHLQGFGIRQDMYAASNEQVTDHFTGNRMIGHLVDAHFVRPCAAFGSAYGDCGSSINS